MPLMLAPVSLGRGVLLNRWLARTVAHFARPHNQMSAYPTPAIDARVAEASLPNPNWLMPQSNNSLRKAESCISQAMKRLGTSFSVTALSRCASVLTYTLEA